MNFKESDNDWSESFKAELEAKLEAKRKRFEHEVVEVRTKVKNDAQEQLENLVHEHALRQKKLVDGLEASLREFELMELKAQETMKNVIQGQRLFDFPQTKSQKEATALREKFEHEAAETQEKLKNDLNATRKKIKHEAEKRQKTQKAKHEAERKMIEQNMAEFQEKLNMYVAAKREKIEHEAANVRDILNSLL